MQLNYTIPKESKVVIQYSKDMKEDTNQNIFIETISYLLKMHA